MFVMKFIFNNKKEHLFSKKAYKKTQQEVTSSIIGHDLKLLWDVRLPITTEEASAMRDANAPHEHW